MADPPRAAATAPSDSLLRFFDSEWFDAWMAMIYLHRTDNDGTHDYLCNRLFDLPERDVEAVLPQLVSLALARPHSRLGPSLARLCGRSLRLGVKCYWLALAAAQEGAGEAAAALRDACERAALSGPADGAPLPAGPLRPLSPASAPRSGRRTRGDGALSPVFRSRLASPALSAGGASPPTSPDGSRRGGGGGGAVSPRNDDAMFSDDETREWRRTRSPATTEDGEAGGGRGRSLSSPLAPADDAAAGGALSPDGRPLSPGAVDRGFFAARAATVGATLDLVEALTDAAAALTSFSPDDRAWALRRGLDDINRELDAAAAEGVGAWWPLSAAVGGERVVRLAPDRARLLASRDKAPFLLVVEVVGDESGGGAGDAAAVRASSPHGGRRGWALKRAIVKSGDDCRLELLAAQLVGGLDAAFRGAGLPLRLRPYGVLPTGGRTALIEAVPDAVSIHALKAALPPNTSLAAHFFTAHPRGTPAGAAAQRAFVESMAAYSLATYLFAVRDRHNGNLLLAADGAVVHIDYGFMLGASPGGVSFEAAPFKLTRELLEVMDSDAAGSPSPAFDAFKLLLVSGFLAARRAADRLVGLVEVAAAPGGPLAARGGGGGGARAAKALAARFMPGAPDHAAVAAALGLVGDSLDAWRSRQYDYYQRVLNGIL